MFLAGNSNLVLAHVGHQKMGETKHLTHFFTQVPEEGAFFCCSSETKKEVHKDETGVAL